MEVDERGLGRFVAEELLQVDQGCPLLQQARRKGVPKRVHAHLLLIDTRSVTSHPEGPLSGSLADVGSPVPSREDPRVGRIMWPVLLHGCEGKLGEDGESIRPSF